MALESGEASAAEGAPSADESEAVESRGVFFWFRYARSFWARFASGVSA